MTRRALLSFALRLTAAATALTILAWVAGEIYVRTCLPLYRAVVSSIAPYGWRVDGPQLDVIDGERVLALSAHTLQHVFVAGAVAPPGSRVDASTLAGHALQHPVVLFSIVIGWPGLGWRRPLALAIALPLLIAVEAVDVPLVLIGAFEDLVFAASGSQHTSLLVAWMNFMNAGGRIGLCLAAAVVAVALTGRR